MMILQGSALDSALLATLRCAPFGMTEVGTGRVRGLARGGAGWIARRLFSKRLNLPPERLRRTRLTLKRVYWEWPRGAGRGGD